MEKDTTSMKLFNAIRNLIEGAKSKIVRSVNSTMVMTYFEIGRMISGMNKRVSTVLSMQKKFFSISVKSF